MQIRLNKNNMNQLFQQSWVEKWQLLSPHSKLIWLFFMSFSVMLLRVQHTKISFLKKREEKNSPTVLIFLMFDLSSFFTCLVRTSDSGYNVAVRCIKYDMCVYLIKLFFWTNHRLLSIDVSLLVLDADERYFISFETTISIFRICVGKELESALLSPHSSWASGKPPQASRPTCDWWLG